MDNIKIPLVKSTFLSETDTRNAMSAFILDPKNRLSMGNECTKFEEKFSAFQWRKHSILFNSGGSSNLAVLQALKNMGMLNPGDNVGFSALTWATNVMPIIQMGLNPIPIDCGIHSLNVMSSNIEDILKLNPNNGIKAFFITHALGFMGDIDKIRDICAEKHIILLEDNCESLGSQISSGKAGNFGIASTFSFYVAHHMSTIEGGMVCTDNDELADMLKIVRSNGWDRNLSESSKNKIRTKYGIDAFYASYAFYDLGYNLRPTEITGVIGICQLRQINEAINRRNINYHIFKEACLKNKDTLELNHPHMSLISNFAFPLIFKSKDIKDIYVRKFEDEGVEIRPIIGGNIQRQPFYKKYIKSIVSTPNTDFIHDCGFYFGNYPDMSDEDISRLVNLIRKR